MSGLLYEAVTPCPSRGKTSRFDRSSAGNSTFSLWEDDSTCFDDTQDIEFTTEIKPSVLTGAKPRRKNKTASSFQIHDEHEEAPARPVTSQKRETRRTIAPSGRKSSLLAQPAQRFRPKVSFGPSPSSEISHARIEPESKVQNTALDAEENKALLMQINGKDNVKKDPLKKDVRRDTVYIPTEDTTVASAFMGLFSPIKSQTTSEIANFTENTEINSLEAQIVRKRQAKRSLTSSARRAPLQQSSKIAQEAAIRVDVAGKNGGKENVPPGGLVSKAKSRKDQFPIFDESQAKGMPMTSNPVKPRLNTTSAPAKSGKPLAARTVNASSRRPALGVKENNAAPKVNVSQKKDIAKNKKVASETKTVPRTSTLTNPLKRSKIDISKVSGPSVKAKKLDLEYPLLNENIASSKLYDDGWLSHQEVVITQLANGLFNHKNGSLETEEPATLRHELLEIYQDDFFPHFHKRLQASLLYGAMSIPKDTLARNTRLKQDVGLKRRVLDIWTKTYDLRALRAAVETVIGRQVSNDSTTDEKTLKRKLESFLDTFLLQNEDMKHHVETGRDADLAGQAYRRTILRSIMIVVLLDKARLTTGTMLPRRLFVSSSLLKSSAGVIQNLARLLLPAPGDIIKSLYHVDCQLSYKQHELQEYEYQISNLAVDLRDGVRLTRIVELVLYSASCPDQDGDWPLSQRLKFPCLSRATKLYNVQIALDTLASVNGGNTLVRDVRAEDIINGHREKTIALLWGLVGKWGLTVLVDRDEVRKEIKRLRHKAAAVWGYDRVKDETWYTWDNSAESDVYTSLLKHWACLLACLKGVRIDNFSTSFADGKIYESIVDEYEGYLGVSDNQSASLKSRLQGVGCSAEFANLVCPDGLSLSHIFDSEFTLGGLAFLCSRLLSASRRARAAMVVQRAWRRFRDQRV
ncbi:hypothetical protein MW887_010220 [Aspergillus wentii]|nr:hypothetical protein MW887_010220 [Aspergillus wentii]